MKKFYTAMIAFILGLIPQLSYAAMKSIEELEKTQLFEVSAIDPSKRFLEQLFGTVGPVLHGTSGILLGLVFKIFNIGIIVVASAFLVWATIKTVITTSHEGKFMGAQGKPSWLILRTVLGLGLLTPNFTTGYSTIQVFVMWVVVQGIGFANTAWIQVVDYIEGQGTILAQPSAPTSDVFNMVGTIMQMEVCMYTHEEIEGGKRKEALSTAQVPGLGGPSPDATRFSDFRYQQSQTSFYFPAMRGNEDAGCGRVSWVTPGSDTNRQNLTKQALELVISGLGPAAQRIASQYSADPSRLAEIKKSAQDLSVNRIIGGTADFLNVTLPLRNVTRQFLAEALKGLTPGSAQAVTGGFDVMLKPYFQLMRDRGWLYAGSFYYTLGKLQGDVTKAANVEVDINVGPVGFESLSGVARYIMFSSSSMSPTYSKAEDFPPELGQYYDQIQLAVAEAKKQYNQTQAQIGKLRVEVGMDVGMHAPYIDPIIDNENQALEGFARDAPDPIMKLYDIGTIMIRAALIAWIVISVTIFLISLFSSLFPMVNPAGYAFISMFMFFMPIFMALVASIFIQGVVLTIYVPFVPLLIYAFTALGWFALVVETMAAAPIVALGMTHPEGHDLLGAAQQAIMLLLSVFLRPILMVIGLVAGMLLSRIGLRYLEEGFITVLAGTQRPYWILTFIPLFYMYLAVVIAVIHTAYNLIHEVPSKVMRWIGLSGEQAGAAVASALSGAKGGAEKGGQVIGQGMQESGMAASEAGKGVGQAIKSAMGGEASAGGGGGGGGSGGEEEGEAAIKG